MNLKFILSMLFFTNTSFANTSIVGLGNPGSIDSFNLYLSENPSKKSLTETLISKQIRLNDLKIEDKYQLATKGILMADLKPSIYLYKEITNSKSSLIFSKKSSDYISESYYRLANLDRTKSNFWVKEALFFNPSYTPSSTIFNPIIIKSFETQKQEILNYSFKFKKNDFADFNTQVFINGSPLTDTATIHPSGHYQVTLFKKGFKETSLNLMGEEIPAMRKTQLQQINLGSCKKPIFPKYKGIQVNEVFFSKNCVKKQSDFASTPSSNPNAELSKSITKAANQSKSKSGTNIFQKPTTWYIIAGTIVASALIISLNNQSKDVSVEPVHR